MHILAIRAELGYGQINGNCFWFNQGPYEITALSRNQRFVYVTILIDGKLISSEVYLSGSQAARAIRQAVAFAEDVDTWNDAPIFNILSDAQKRP